jgi:gamma-glutamyltranspeptidase
MNRRHWALFAAALILAGTSIAQRQVYERVVVDQGSSSRTMKPLVMGTRYAVSSMMPQATLPAQRMLEAGANAFDAIVTGQAVLGLVQPATNGIGGDAVLLIYDARAKKVWSINAEGTAPKFATIEWYRTHNNGKIPSNETLLSATIPGVIDAWYILLSRWGTKSFAQVLAPYRFTGWNPCVAFVLHRGATDRGKCL